MKTEKMPDEKVQDPVYDAYCGKCNMTIEAAFTELGENEIRRGYSYLMGKCPECKANVWYNKRKPKESLIDNDLKFIWGLMLFVLVMAIILVVGQLVFNLMK